MNVCACEGPFVCSRCRVSDRRDYEVLSEWGPDEIEAQARWEREHAPDQGAETGLTR